MAEKMLYILTPLTNISPFDVTMAADAGFHQVLPFTEIQPDAVTGMVQDAIFCRPPKRFNDTGIFISGRDVHLATDMFQNAKTAMVGDFQVGIFADPNGAYTTSASVVALVEQALERHHGGGLADRTVAVFGAGPVGLCTAVLAARQGAKVRLCQLTADDDARVASRFCNRYDVDVSWVSALTHEEKVAALDGVDVVICAAKAGIRILDKVELDTASRLLVAADTNAVPPSGVEGVGLQDQAVLAESSTGAFHSIGPLAIGNLKYRTQFGLFERIQTSEEVALIDFTDAYDHALSLLGA